MKQKKYSTLTSWSLKNKEGKGSVIVVHFIAMNLNIWGKFLKLSSFSGMTFFLV